MGKIPVDAESINRYLADVVAESAIGEVLKKAIDEELKRVTTGWGQGNPMALYVREAIGDAAREYLATPTVKERIREHVASVFTPEYFEGVTDALVKRVADAAARDY